MNPSIRTGIFLTLLCLISWAGGLGIRRAVLAQQTRTLDGKEAPFLMESALQFRMTRMVDENGTLPDVDEHVQVPEGVVMRETYSVGAEWVYSRLASLLPQSWTLASRVRWVSTALFCLAIPFAALWARSLSGSIWAGWITAGILCASPSFAVRSSGLELSRENLAIPLFTLFLWLESRLRRESSVRRQWIAAIFGALALALAQCVWDLTQMVTGLWIVWCWLRVLKTPDSASKDLLPVGCVAVALAVAAVCNPYLRSHGALLSPVMALVIARALGSLHFPFLSRRWAQVVLLLLFLIGFWGLGRLFNENYSHFGELLMAKIRHLNVKPMDPSVLTFSQRIMWTPALNSTTWELTKAYFLFTFIIFSISMVMLVLGEKKGNPSLGLVIFSSLFLFPVTILFFRFHVFWVLFAAVASGSGFASLFKNNVGFRWNLIPVVLFLLISGGELFLLLFFEPSTSSSLPAEQAEFRQLVKAMGGDITQTRGNRWGRPGASYRALESLSAQIKALPDQGPILANFGISASILAETEFPIVLHPKFETPGIRERVREFYEHLFLGTEESLRDYALRFGTRYYVHSMGNLSDLDIRNSPRYMVDAVEPPDHAPVYVFENRPAEATYFRPVGGNERYRIYRIVLPEDEQFAQRFTEMARQAWEAGDLETAQRRARQALSYHWKHKPAQDLLAALLSL